MRARRVSEPASGCASPVDPSNVFPGISCASCRPRSLAPRSIEREDFAPTAPASLRPCSSAERPFFASLISSAAILVAKITNLVMVRDDALVLTLDDLANRRRQILLQCVCVFRLGVVFAALALF